MFKVIVEESILNHCERQIIDFNFGCRSTANGNPEQQLTGIIGQSVVMDFFQEGYVDGTSGFDGGVDLIFAGKTIDVKTMGRTTDVRENYTNNFLQLQDYFSTEIYIFCSYHKIKKELTVCGWITKEDFQMRRRFFPKGSVRQRSDGSSFITFSDLFEIDNIDLNHVQDVADLKLQIRNFADG